MVVADRDVFRSLRPWRVSCARAVYSGWFGVLLLLLDVYSVPVSAVSQAVAVDSSPSEREDGMRSAMYVKTRPSLLYLDLVRRYDIRLRLISFWSAYCDPTRDSRVHSVLYTTDRCLYLLVPIRT